MNIQGTDVSGQLAEPPAICFVGSEVKSARRRESSLKNARGGQPETSDNWRWQMRRRVKTFASLCRALPDLRGVEAVKPVLARYPMAITPYYLSLIRRCDLSDPIFLQCVPQAAELQSPFYCRPDPLHELKHSPVPLLVHRYPDRALSLTSSTCPVYCRHCTRKRMAGVRESCISRSALDRQIDYLNEHTEIREVVISGGDPLTMSTEQIEFLLSAFRSVPSVRIIRIGTRTPVTLPMRITDELCAMLERYHPLWICTHFNHPREVTTEAACACEKLLRAGIPVLNQSVLLRGVNDSVEIMTELCRELLSIRVRPYYLFQCDLVSGVEHFRTPLARGIEITEALRTSIGGIGVPQFMVDAPEGGGKIPVAANRVIKMEEGHALLRNLDGKVITCPEPGYHQAPLSGKSPESTGASFIAGGSRIALVFNLKKTPVSISDSDAEYDAPETIDIIAQSIESLGHAVIRMEADSDLPAKLAASKADVVFNIAESAGTRGREGHVPALCEMMNMAYTGSDQTTLALALDKALTKTVLMQHGIATPPFRLIRSTRDVEYLDLRYPLIVKPNHEGSSKGLRSDSVADNPKDVESLTERVLRCYNQPAIVEECLFGREFTVGFIGPGEPEVLPLLEIRFLDPTRAPIYDLELKQDPPGQVEHLCPAPLEQDMAGEIIALARRAYIALSCRDIGRVDIRLDKDGRPQVIEVNPLPGLAPRYSDICKMTEALGWSHVELISRLLAPALDRSNTRGV